MSENISITDQAKQSRKTGVKCRFFAQYWEQKVLFFEDKGFTSYTINAPNMFGKGITSQLDNAFLKLNHISKITDEDAVQVMKIHYLKEYDSKLNSSIKSMYLKNVKYLLVNDFDKLNRSIVDYLRSKGYAVPFMEYSVEDLVSFGWVRFL